jgi:hypothetical protein
MTTAVHFDPFRMAWQALRRRPWLAASLAVHAMLLGLLYYTGFYLPERDTQQRRVAASGRADSHDAMRRRVSDMERIKDLMRESLGETDAVAERAVRFDATTVAPDPGDMLAQAEALAREIDALGARAGGDGKSPAPPAGTAGEPGTPAARDGAQDKLRDQAGGTAQQPAPPAARERDAADPAVRGRDADSGAGAPGNLAASAGASVPGGAPPASASAAGAAGSMPSMADGAAGSGAKDGAGAAGGDGGNGGSGHAGSAATAAGAAARIAALEQHARDVLVRRQGQLEKAGQAGQGGAAVPPGVTERIGAFVRRDMHIGGSASGRYHTNGMELFHQGRGRMATVDTAAMRKGGGRLLGAGGPFSNRVYVNSWYLIGPFAGKHGTGMFDNDSYPPEQAVELDAAYRGKDGRFLTWRYVQSASYPLVPPDPQEDSVYYGYTEVMMDTERELAVWIGADDDARVWINDQLVWKGGNINKHWFFQEIYDMGIDYATPYNLNEGKVVVRFRKGRNKLFFKLSNGPTRLFFSMVLAPP